MVRKKIKSSKRPWVRDHKIDTSFIGSYMKLLFIGIIALILVFFVLHYRFILELTTYIEVNNLRGSMGRGYEDLLKEQKETFNMVIMITAGFGLIGSMLLGRTISKVIKQPIERMCAHFEKFSNLGNAKRISEEDECIPELAQAYNRLVMRRPPQNRRDPNDPYNPY